ncbi:TPA: hypothetical protein DCW56_03720 [Candidatus Peregrinibacteria bacterium]|nr:hypothetical protein [Candidatus Peregrinibacteria bacterium]
MSTMHREQLYKLGFSEKEASVYLTLLRIGPSVASTLARLSNIRRTSIYDVLNGLTERNLIGSYKQGKDTYFVVEDVNNLYFQEKQKTDIAKRLAADLKKSMNWQGIRVNYYVGYEGYREIYEEILRAKPKELLTWIHLDNFYKGLDMKREEEWTAERINKKIHARLIIQDTEFARKFIKDDFVSYRETRLVKNFPFSTTCSVYQDTILLFNSTNEIEAVRIKNGELAKMFYQMFEMNWRMLPKK